MADLTPEQAVVFGVPEEFIRLVVRKDRSDLKNGYTLELIRTISDWRNQLRVMYIQADPSLKENVDALNEKMMEPSPIDKWDSGIIYLVGYHEDGTMTARVISQMDSYTPKIVASTQLIEETLKQQLALDSHTTFRKWYEGTTVRVTTFEIEGVHMTIYSTRSKIQAVNSKWAITQADSPTILSEFNAACRAQKITQASIEIPGISFAFVLSSPWNAARYAVEKPTLTLFRSYSFADGEYREINKDVPGAKSVEVLDVEQAVEYIENGGIVITMYPFNNKKFLTEHTQEIYSWFEGNDAATPVERYFKLSMIAQSKAKQYRNMLSGPLHNSLEHALSHLDSNIDATAGYLQHCVKVAVKLRHAAKGQEKPTLHENGTIQHIIRQVMTQYVKEKEEREKKQEKPGKGRGKKSNVKGRRDKNRPKMADVDASQIEFIKGILLEYKEKDPVKLVKLIRKCASLKKTEIARLKAQQQREQDANRPVTPTFDREAKKELEKTLQNLSEFMIEEDVVYFVPAQYDDEEDTMFTRVPTGVTKDDRDTGGMGVWVREKKSDPRSPTTFSDDE